MKNSLLFLICFLEVITLQAQSSPAFFFRGNVPLQQGECYYQNTNIAYNHLLWAPHRLLTVGVGTALISRIAKIPSIAVSGALKLPLGSDKFGMSVGGYYQFARANNLNSDNSRYSNVWLDLNYRFGQSLVALQGGVYSNNYWSFLTAGYGLLGSFVEYIESDFVEDQNPYVALQYTARLNDRIKLLSEFSYVWIDKEDSHFWGLGVGFRKQEDTLSWEAALNGFLSQPVDDEWHEKFVVPSFTVYLPVGKAARSKRSL